MPICTSYCPAGIGIPAALLAAGLLALAHELEHLLREDLPAALGHSSPPLHLVIALPVAGAALVAIARTVLPGDGGVPVRPLPC